MQGRTRVVTWDVEFHGRQLRKGDRVMLMFAAANRDPSAFECPQDINLDRGTNRHMAFALGVHRYLGSNFARAMFRVMNTELLRRLPDVHVAAPLEHLADAGDVYAVGVSTSRFASLPGRAKAWVRLPTVPAPAAAVPRRLTRRLVRLGVAACPERVLSPVE